MYNIGHNDMPRGFSTTPYYQRWHMMYQRCYARRPTQPTYKGCYVCVRWRKLSSFVEWMRLQDWQGKQLDKDLLGECCFISRELNHLIEPRGVPIDMSDQKREKVANLMRHESDVRVLEALKARYDL